MKKYLHTHLAKLSFQNKSLCLSLLVAFFCLCTDLKVSAQCTAQPGILAGSGSFCDGDQINVGIPKTKKSQTYTWYQNGTKVVKGPVSGNGDGISYNALMAPAAAGHYTVVTEKSGCTSTEFGDVNIVYTGAPSGLNKLSYYYDSVQFSWNKIPDVLGYHYAVDTDSLPPDTDTFTFDTVATVHNLNPFTNYYIHVRASSSNGGECSWAKLKFNTALASGDGSLDTTFSNTGKTSITIGDFCEATTQIIQPDGRIIVAGTSYKNGYDFTLVRYNTDGTLDKSFGKNSKVITDINGNDFIYAVALQSNEKIIVAGVSFNTGESEIELVRYDTKGAIDPHFGVDGKVFTDVIPGHGDIAQALAVQPNGKIVVAGYAYNGVTNDIILTRYNTDGTLDQGFGDGGKVITDFGADEFANGMTLQSDGKIIVVGNTNNSGSDNNFFVARYKTDGALDNNFGSNGKTFTDFSGNNDYAYSAVIQSGGRVLVCGTSFIPSTNNSSVALARYNKNGLPDKAFGINGISTYTDVYNGFSAQSVIVTSDKKIIAAGSAYNGSNNDALLLGFTFKGKVDSSFGYNGRIFTDFNLHNEFIYAAGLQTDGKIVVSGVTTDNLGNDKIFAARYNSGTGSGPLKPTSSAEKLIAKSVLSKIIISPNPANDILNISGFQPLISKHIYIMDITGRVLQTFTTSAINYSCNVNRLPAGVYFISIEESKKFSYLKFVKE